MCHIQICVQIRLIRVWYVKFPIPLLVDSVLHNNYFTELIRLCMIYSVYQKKSRHLWNILPDENFIISRLFFHIPIWPGSDLYDDTIETDNISRMSEHD